jgi:hypothetical protein
MTRGDGKDGGLPFAAAEPRSQGTFVERLNDFIAALESAVLRIGLLVLTICKLVEFVRHEIGI